MHVVTCHVLLVEASYMLCACDMQMKILILETFLGIGLHGLSTSDPYDR